MIVVEKSKEVTKPIFQDQISHGGQEGEIITAVQCRLHVLCLSLLGFDHISPGGQTFCE